VGQESEVGKEAGVVWEVYARVSGAACWEMGVMIWMQFKEAVMLELGNFLFQIWVRFQVLRRVWYIWCAGECSHYAGRHVIISHSAY